MTQSTLFAGIVLKTVKASPWTMLLALMIFSLPVPKKDPIGPMRLVLHRTPAVVEDRRRCMRAEGNRVRKVPQCRAHGMSAPVAELH